MLLWIRCYLSITVSHRSNERNETNFHRLSVWRRTSLSPLARSKTVPSTHNARTSLFTGLYLVLLSLPTSTQPLFLSALFFIWTVSSFSIVSSVLPTTSSSHQCFMQMNLLLSALFQSVTLAVHVFLLAPLHASWHVLTMKTLFLPRNLSSLYIPIFSWVPPSSVVHSFKNALTYSNRIVAILCSNEGKTLLFYIRICIRRSNHFE